MRVASMTVGPSAGYSFANFGDFGWRYVPECDDILSADPHLTPTQHRFGRVKLLSLTIRLGAEERGNPRN